MLERDENVDHLEARLVRPQVDRRQLDEQREAQIGDVAQRAAEGNDVIAGDVQRGVHVVAGGHLQRGAGEDFLQTGDKRGRIHHVSFC